MNAHRRRRASTSSLHPTLQTSYRKLVWLGKFILVLFLLTTVQALSAQNTGAIAGVVKDATDAVIADAKVVAVSDALIEGSRATTSGANGEYRLVDLRPGTYTVTFTRDGFRSLKRGGIVLDASFTITVNGDLVLGEAVQEITVTDAPPLVDTQNSLSETTVDRKRLDEIPTGRDPFAVGQVIPGVTTATPDIGGTQGMQQPTLQVHGSAASDNVFFVDGMWMQMTSYGGNQTGFYFNDSQMQSISYLTSTLPAEAPAGGIQINMLSRDGGNQLHGSIYGTGATQGFQSDNSNPALETQGLKARNKIDTLYDLDAGLGGPIVKDRLWFYSTFRRWGANNFLGNTFTSTGAQAIDDNRLTDISLRLTTQFLKKNKFSIFYDRGLKFRGHRPNDLIGASFSDPLAFVVQRSWLNYMGQAKWTSTITDRFLLDAGVIYMPVNWNTGFEPGADTSAVSQYDVVTSTILKIAPLRSDNRGSFTTYTGNASYITGAHIRKTGIQARVGWWQQGLRTNGDTVQILSNGAPTSLRLYNTSLTHREDMNPDLGWFLQDSWRFRPRLSLNLGIRFDHMVMSIPAQSSAGGTWVGPRSFAAVGKIVDWNTWSPRIGVAWDVFGDGKTAIKGGISKYDRLEGTNLAQNVNPNFIAYQTCPWTKLTLPTPGTVPTGCTGFSGNNNHIDPDIKRPYQWEYTAMIQHQIASGTSISAAYYGRRFFDLYGVVNTAVPQSSYLPVTIQNPLSSGTLTVYNQVASTLGQINLVQKTLPNLYQHYNGVEFQVNSQLRNLTVYAGFTIGKSFGTPDGATTTADFNNPNNLINYAGNLGYDSTYQIRSGFTYTLPKKILIAGTLRENSGLPQSRSYTVTQAIVPGLTQVTQSILVAPSGQFRYPWQNLLDLRVSRTFHVKDRVVFEPIADLYNVFNASATTSAVTTIGPSLLKPSSIDMGRLLRVGGRISF